jgi:hypothetical protein
VQLKSRIVLWRETKIVNQAACGIQNEKIGKCDLGDREGWCLLWKGALSEVSIERRNVRKMMS